jgi:hypothetical protein
MKKTIQYISLIILTLFAISCQDVVDVDLNTAPPKLVIDASINWAKGTSGSEQKIILTTTTDFYSDIIPVVHGATVYITNSTNTIFNFIENATTGEYICSNFIPVLNENYILTVISNGQTYTASETLKSVVPIDHIVQKNDGGFTGKDIEIKAFFNDPIDETNYYMYKYKYSNIIKSDYNVREDTFFQGNQFFSISRNRKLKAGDQIEITHFGISKTYFNYMNVLLSISGSQGGSPFQTPSATVRGNIINTTNFDNYALGYFRLSETDTKNYIVQ